MTRAAAPCDVLVSQRLELWPRREWMAWAHTAPGGVTSVGESAPKKPARPLIFISHDHRDAQLAEAFGNLLGDASGGFLRSFRSSDRKGGAGIEFGAEWYSEIIGKINDATDVVAILTPRSIDPNFRTPLTMPTRLRSWFFS